MLVADNKGGVIMYDCKDVCASIVTCNCDTVTNQNIEALVKQVAHIVIIDNHSKIESQQLLSRWVNHEKITFITHNTNAGLAIRLNEALQWATKHNYRLLLTMDQDTVLADTAVREMIQVMNSNAKVCSVGPNRSTKKYTSIYQEVKYLITSGNLVKVDVANAIQGYQSELFIDYIDLEFSLHLRSKGYLLAVANAAKMEHKVGELESNTILGFSYSYLSHSPTRFYYIYRNYRVLSKMYFKTFPFFITKLSVLLIIDTIKIVFEKYRKEKFIAAFKGFRDGKKIGRMR